MRRFLHDEELQWRVRVWEVRKVIQQDAEASPTMRFHCFLWILNREFEVGAVLVHVSLFLSCRHVMLDLMSMCISHARMEEAIVIGTWDLHMFYKTVYWSFFPSLHLALFDILVEVLSTIDILDYSALLSVNTSIVKSKLEKFWYMSGSFLVAGIWWACARMEEVIVITT